MASAEHSAVASAAGYLYQVRWALLHLLREGRTRPDQVLSLEMHDDVGWEDQRGTATELLQTKRDHLHEVVKEVSEDVVRWIDDDDIESHAHLELRRQSTSRA